MIRKIYLDVIEHPQIFVILILHLKQNMYISIFVLSYLESVNLVIKNLIL